MPNNQGGANALPFLINNFILYINIGEHRFVSYAFTAR